jgi:hypothetical protein
MVKKFALAFLIAALLLTSFGSIISAEGNSSETEYVLGKVGYFNPSTGDVSTKPVDPTGYFPFKVLASKGGGAQVAAFDKTGTYVFATLIKPYADVGLEDVQGNSSWTKAAIARGHQTIIFCDLNQGIYGKLAHTKLPPYPAVATVWIPNDTKAAVLSGSGVPGKGLDKAPGLQKEFNPNSQAADNAGKK